MKTEKIVSRAIVGFLFAQAVLYGGSKPPMPTNPPPDSASSPTNAVEESKAKVEVEQWNLSTCASGLEKEGNILCSPSPLTFTSLTAWHKRGAYCDWERIPFSDGFRFPVGTNFIDGVTLFAYGELKSNLHCSPSTFTYSLPTRVSIEPNVSSVTHGLTPSNSYLFSWHNCCANRSATNRVDASIELFDSGAVAIRTSSDVQPPTYNLQPPIVPEGFYGHGQNDAWLAASFPSHYAAITNLGYDAWLDGHIGHNEPNGLYKLSVTIAALPEHGPCYLFCGPYKMVVTSPGTYCFPLVDMTEYDLYTSPTEVPLTWEMDDGWDSFPEDDPLFAPPAPPMLLSAPQSNNRYKIERHPRVGVSPNFLTREQAMRELIQIRCNVAGIAARDYRSLSGLAVVLFNQSDAIIRESLIQDEIYLSYHLNGRETTGTLHIRPEPSWHNPTNDCPNATNEYPGTTSTNGNASATN